MEVTIKCVLDAKKENRIIIVPSTITDTQLSQKLGQTFGCPVRLAKYEDPRDKMLITIDSVSNLQHAFKVYAQMHLHDPLLALLLFLDLDTSSNLSSRPTGVASSSATSAIPSSSASVPDFADSAFRRVTETRKGSTPSIPTRSSPGDSFRTPPKSRPELSKSVDDPLIPPLGSSPGNVVGGGIPIVLSGSVDGGGAPKPLGSPQAHRRSRDIRRVSGLATKSAAEALSAPATLTHSIAPHQLINTPPHPSHPPSSTASQSGNVAVRPRGSVGKVQFLTGSDGTPVSSPPVYDFTPPPSPRGDSQSGTTPTTATAIPSVASLASQIPSQERVAAAVGISPPISPQERGGVPAGVLVSSPPDRMEFSRTPPLSPERLSLRLDSSAGIGVVNPTASASASGSSLSNPPPPLDKADASNSLLGRSMPQTQIQQLSSGTGGDRGSGSASSSTTARLSGSVNSAGVRSPPSGSAMSSHVIKFTLPDPKILLGWGAFGAVYLGMRDTGSFVAVKQLQLTENATADQLELVDSFEKEIQIMKRLSHPNIVAYLGTQRTQNSLNIILEYVPGGSIASLLKRFGPFPEPVIRSYTRQALLGLRYLHEHQPNPVVHRDIKGGNILVDQSGVVKLADFGCSKIVVSATVPAGAKSGVTGTPNWMAPEAIHPHSSRTSTSSGGVTTASDSFSASGVVQGAPADIWSLGCTVIEMGTAKVPWAEQQREITALMFMIVTSTALPEFPAQLSELGREFLHSCLKRDPTQRLSAAALLQHPFLEVLPSDSPSHSGNPHVIDDTDPTAAGSRVAPPLHSAPAVIPVSAPSSDSNALRTTAGDTSSSLQQLNSAFSELRNSDLREIQTAVHEHQSLLHSMAMKALLSVPGSISRLSSDLIVRILLLCGNSAEELVRYSLVCKTWYQYLTDDVIFWKRLYEHRYRGLEPKRDITQAKGRKSANLSARQKYFIQRTLEMNWRDLRQWNSALLKASSSFRSGKVTVGCLRAKETQWAVSCGFDDSKKIRLWDIGKKKSGKSLKGHTGSVTCLSLDANWSRLYSGSTDRTVRLWDVTSRKLLRTFSGHSDDVSAVVHFEPARFASACRDRTVRVWDTVTGACVAVWGNSVLLCEPINDHLMMSASESDNSWKIWDLRMYSNINTSAGGTTASSSSSSSSCIPFPSSSSESSVTYRSSSASLISCILMASSISVYCGDQQGQLREWDLRMYNKNSTSSSYGCVSVRNAHSDSVRELQLSEDGLCLVSASRDHTIKLWSRFALSDKPLHSLQTDSAVQAVVALNERGKLLSASAGEKGIRLWSCSASGAGDRLSSSSASMLSSTLGGSTSSVGSV